MTSFSVGDVVEVPFPFVDVPVRKRRPALVLALPEADGDTEVAILSMITSARRSRWDSDVTLEDWRAAGLRAPSLVRWKIFTLERSLVLNRRGSLSVSDLERVSQQFRTLFREHL